MKKSACSFIAIFLFIIPFYSIAQQLGTFDELMSALKDGRKVTAVIHYAKFKLISDNEEQEKVPDAIGGMDLSTWEYFAPNAVKNKDAFVVFSENMLIKNPKGEGFVYDYVKVRISSDNKVKITAQYLETNSLSVKMDVNFFGILNDGKNDGGMTLFVSK
jgi:hypothetical protein